MSSVSNPGNYLRTSRNFPTDPQALTVEINKAYVDIANQVNNRISGIFGTAPTITGETWFLSGEAGRQQTLREVFNITGAGTYAHNINFATVSRVTKMYGNFVDGSGIWYTLPYVDVVAANNQISLTVDATNIIITAGAGTPPTIVRGQVVLEWLSQI